MFPQMLRRLRDARKWSREDLVYRLLLKFGEEGKVSSGTIENWEMGKHLPRLDDAIRLAELFGVALEFLAFGERRVERSTSPDEAWPARRRTDAALGNF